MKMSTIGVWLATAGFASVAPAQTGSVRIVSPADGAVLPMTKPIDVSYEVVRGGKVDHIHLYVDGKQMAILRESMGSHRVNPLAAGMHAICIKAVTSSHVATGVEQCSSVTVQ